MRRTLGASVHGGGCRAVKGQGDINAETRRSLAALSGKTHRLTSAFCVARSGQSLVVDSDHADLSMRALDPATISRYLDRAGPGRRRRSAAIRSA